MELIPLTSEKFVSGSGLLPGVNEALKAAGQKPANKDILVVASKVLAYSQGRLGKVDSDEDFRNLVRLEADKVLDEGNMVLTMKNKVLIPNAGIDRSNAPEGQVVLWPENPFESAENLRQALKKEYTLRELGIIISDSHCQPLRMGTSGIAIGWAGFQGVQDERGSEDLFGRKMQYTKIAMADNLASAANVLMGESDAGVPFVLVRRAPVQFTDDKGSEKDYFISPDECLYRSLYKFDK